MTSITSSTTTMTKPTAMTTTTKKQSFLSSGISRTFNVALITLLVLQKAILDGADAFVLDPCPCSCSRPCPSTMAPVEKLRWYQTNALLRYPPPKIATNVGVKASSQNYDDDNNNNASGAKPRTTPKSTGLPISVVLLGLLALRSLQQLFSPTEIPGNFFFVSGGEEDFQPAIDWIGTAFDIFFVGYGTQTLIQQTGLLRSDTQPLRLSSSSSTSPLVGVECLATLDMGREQGTWMEDGWGASGARFGLSVPIRFSAEEIDLGVPGEEALGGRYCRRLQVMEPYVSFLTPSGETRTRVDDGGWVLQPLSSSSSQQEANAGTTAARLRFFLDFPEGATKRDVVVPPGTRVFFSSVVFLHAPPTNLGPGERVLWVSSNDASVGLLDNGGLTIKRNNLWNLYGALGDVNLIFGRFQLSNVNFINPIANENKDEEPLM